MRRRADALEAFDLHCKMLENSDPAAFQANELDRAALALLQRRRMAPAELDCEDRLGAADSVFPEMDDIVDKSNRNQPLTFQDQVIATAYQKLTSVEKSKPRTLQQLWAEYAREKSFDRSTRVGRRQWQWWDKLIAVLGDCTVSPGAIDRIHTGLDRYVELRLSGVDPVTGEKRRPVKGQSVQREISQPVAALRRASRRYRLGWVIDPPSTNHDAPKKRQSLSVEDQVAFVSFCTSSEQATHAAPAAVALILLQIGGMASEISRLVSEDDERLVLDGEVPYIVISDGKTSDRQRVAPIVLEVDYIRRHVGYALEWLHRVSDSTHSHALARLLATATGKEFGYYTAHSLRHTFRTNSISAGADQAHVAEIAGWSAYGRVNSIMMNYGKTGMTQSEPLKALRATSLKIHKHLINRDSGGKVVSLAG